ncbi:AI-2E family transporter [Natronococcus sp. A-GB7]|uniref:AI-2E family transporter n=1 Tax=Natronococcus sp. A-GB7 TaxID=3037649 RepID=UPI00241F86B9|nr:AI-2E family transporter [Natronococcus sp. A-GB7]MDG5818709.1 AI-2E family transporter [Natronococcus sp. A-GB7]
MTETSGGLTEQSALGIVALVTGILAALLVLPYLQYVLLAVVLAYALAPFQTILERVLSPTASALTLIASSLLVLVIPVLYVLVVAIRQASELVGTIQQQGLDTMAIQDELEGFGYQLDPEAAIAAYEANQGQIDDGLHGLHGAVTGTLEFLGGLPSIAFGLTVTMFVLFGLLRDGDRLVDWLQTVVPISDGARDELFTELDRLMWASVVGNVIVSAIQAVLLGIGLWLLDVPGVVLLTVATFVLALLPLVGAFGIWVPVSIYLVVAGRPLAALALVGYGTFVSVSDMYLRPAIIGKSGALSAAVIVLGIFGGVAMFGAVGLFVGPVILGAAKIAFDLFSREWHGSAA